MPSSIVKDNMFPLALMGVLALGGLCTKDPSPSPPSPLQEIFKYGGFRNSCSIFVLVYVVTPQDLAFWGCRDRDQARLSKSCRDQDFLESLADPCCWSSVQSAPLQQFACCGPPSWAAGLRPSVLACLLCLAGCGPLF